MRTDKKHTPTAADRFHYAAAFTHRLYVIDHTSRLSTKAATHTHTHTMVMALLNSDGLTAGYAPMHLLLSLAFSMSYKSQHNNEIKRN